MVILKCDIILFYQVHVPLITVLNKYSYLSYLVYACSFIDTTMPKISF